MHCASYALYNTIDYYRPPFTWYSFVARHHYRIRARRCLLQGKYDEAVSVLEIVLALSTKTFGGNHAVTVTAARYLEQVRRGQVCRSGRDVSSCNINEQLFVE